MHISRSAHQNSIPKYCHTVDQIIGLLFTHRPWSCVFTNLPWWRVFTHRPWPCVFTNLPWPCVWQWRAVAGTRHLPHRRWCHPAAAGALRSSVASSCSGTDGCAGDESLAEDKLSSLAGKLTSECCNISTNKEIF